MVPTLVHLPNGQTLTVSPVFAGLSFKSNDLNVHHSVFPPGWTIIIESEELEAGSDSDEEANVYRRKKSHVHRYRSPTLHNDNLFISSISNPSNVDFKPATSPTRQIAMMLWATLWWYYHQPAPNPHLTTGVHPNVPEAGRPKGDWRVNIKREGIFKSKLLFPKLERMGLISTEDSCVGEDTDTPNGQGWKKMFASQRSFWQLDARIFLFTLSPTMHSPFPGTTPLPSRPGSPNRDPSGQASPKREGAGSEPSHGLWSPPSPGPFASSSHLPTFYPPPPPQYIMTNGVRHPIRPKPPAQGQIFYTRYVPSIGQFLSFRTASLSPKAPAHRGPVSTTTPPNFLPPNSAVSSSTVPVPSLGSITIQPSDTELLHDWMNNPRVNAYWGAAGPIEDQEAFLRKALTTKHSFPVIGCWDGKPFGYFEIYWVKEDQLGKYITGRDAGDWDRGFHALVGEQEFRGEHRVKVWMSALAHYCWLADLRTDNVFVEPRVDNHKFISYLLQVGFHKEREISFPHKQAALMQICRDAWDAPAL